MSVILPAKDNELYQSLLEVAGEEELHIVGGYVRDLLLGFATVDLDFMIERNLNEFLEKASAKLNGVASHSRFFTANLNLETPLSGHSILDFSQARKENYATPASRPAVSEGSVREDVLRRDFTINSILILKNDFLDLSNGRVDLENRLIRVHHEKSFIDDPIRLLRAVRFKNRLNFKFEEKTESFFNETVKENYLSLVSPRRRFEELRKVFSENKKLAILQELQDRNLLKVLCPAILSNLTQLSESDSFEEGMLKIVEIESPIWVSYVQSLGLAKAESKRLLP